MHMLFNNGCLYCTSVQAIRAILNGHEDLEGLRDLCSKGVPHEVRKEVWQAILGVRRRPDAIGTWNGPLDCENQSLIHQNCTDKIGK